MDRKQLKFIIGPVAVVGALMWIGVTAFNSSMSYFQTVTELYAMEASEGAEGKRLKVMGEVVEGSIERRGSTVNFRIYDTENPSAEPLVVAYTGTVPDTFRDFAEAVVDGSYTDGVFTATALQAKCASKYERHEDAGIVTETSELDEPASGF